MTNKKQKIIFNLPRRAGKKSIYETFRSKLSEKELMDNSFVLPDNINFDSQQEYINEIARTFGCPQKYFEER